MSADAPVALTAPERRLVAEAWAFRREVEREAALRFARLSEQLQSLGAPETLVALARRAAGDEERHAVLCAELALFYGHPGLPAGPLELREVAPTRLGLRERVLYELVAACCVSETESTATLTALLTPDGAPEVQRVLRDILRDEVAHSRLGWAALAREHAVGATGWLSRYVPAMLEGNAGKGLFVEATPDAESPALLRHGVLPHARKREVFVRALEDVVFPGLERFGVDAGPARGWLTGKLAA
ncbi:MAG: ferritin-like domain-containing protein [Myxococcaceae bacterium]|nr:ferritin-like domain-containing protein [Myxococcaceae bacterium]MCI0672557.1 ferritin-like domain-containing protein [Myxococcaceae bacterium]